MPRLYADANGAVQVTRAPGSAIPSTAYRKGGLAFTPDGALYVTDSYIQGFDTAVIIGDSILGGANATTTLASLTSSGTTCTGSWTGSPVNLGGLIHISGANETAYNGLFTVASTSGNSFTYTALSEPSAATATGTINAVLQHRSNDRNYIAIANALMGWPLNYIYNVAVSGTTSATALANFSRDVPALSPDFVIIQTGTNDVYTDVAIATTKENITALIAASFAIGARVLLCTIPPRSDATATAARIAVSNNLNAWIRYTAQTTPGVELCDVFSFFVNPLSSTNAYIANYCGSDNIHPAGKGAQAIAPSVQTAMSRLWRNTPSHNRFVHGITDSVAITAGNQQLVTNPLMQGTAGSTSGTVTGAFVPTSWTITETGSGSCAVTQDSPRSDGYGSNVIMTITSAANNDTVALTSTSFHASLTAGNVIHYEVEVLISGITALNNLEISMDYTVGGTAYFYRANSTSGSSQPWAADGGPYIFRPTVPLTVPSGSITNAQLRVQGTFSGAGGAVIKVARAGVRIIN